MKIRTITVLFLCLTTSLWSAKNLSKQTLLKRLESTDYKVVNHSISQLKKYPEEIIVHALIKKAESSNRLTQQTIVETLISFGALTTKHLKKSKLNYSENSLEILFEVLAKTHSQNFLKRIKKHSNHESWRVRAKIIEAIVLLEDKESAKLLTQYATGDTHWIVRLKAVNALGENPMNAEIFSAISESDANVQVRQAAAMKFTAIQTAEAVVAKKKITLPVKLKETAKTEPQKMEVKVSILESVILSDTTTSSLSQQEEQPELTVNFVQSQSVKTESAPIKETKQREEPKPTLK